MLVSSIPVMPSLYPFKNGSFSFRAFVVLIFVHPFYFQALKERFSYCVIPTIPLSIHTLLNKFLVTFKDFTELRTSILRTSIWVKNQFFSNRSCNYCCIPSCNNDVFSGYVFAQGPSNNFSVE